MDINFYSFSDPLNSGIDFFTVDEFKIAASALTIESNVAVLSSKIAFSQIAIDSNSLVQTSAIKIAFAQSQITDILSATVTVGTRVKNAEIVINSSCLVETLAIKIAHSQCSISIDSNVVSNSTKFARAASDISGSADVSASMKKESRAASNIAVTSSLSVNAIRVRFIAAAMSGSVSLSTAGRLFLITAKINVLSNTDISAKAIRFSTNITADSTLIRTLLLLDNKALTNQTRMLDVSTTPIFTENTNWAGDSSRYYKNSAANGGSKRTFNIKWSFIPNYSNATVDLNESRNYIKNISMDADTHTLTVINQDEDGVTPYTEENVTVFVSSFSENLIRRDLINDVYYFDCALALEEV
jgi:hypothetical protein